jgi:beta-glucanase (GH16 family)
MKLFLAALGCAAIGVCAVPSQMVAPAEGLGSRIALASDACGTQPLKEDGTRWECTFADDFSGRVLDRTKWTVQTAFVNGTSSVYTCFRDDPSNVSVGNGSLTLTLLELKQPAPCGLASVGPTRYQSGMVSTWHKFSQQYGRIQARVKNTGTTKPGLHEAFWMWPDDRYGTASLWPDSGEIDVAETFSIHPKSVLNALHYSADHLGLQDGVTSAVCTARRGVWNTYTLEWAPQKMEFFVNGRSCLVNTSGDPAFQKRYIINFTQGIGPAQMDNMPTSRTPMPATYKIDYIRVWK